jgi:polyisoprenoid-binding protein YceI
MRTLGLVALVAALAVGATARPGAPADFTVDPARSSLVVQLFRDGLAARLGHDHVVRARRFSGTVTYDPRGPGAASIRLEVETASLVADERATRQAFGLPGEPSARDLAEIDAAMKGRDQLDVASYPALTFRSTAISKQPDGRLAVTGRLTIRGITAEVTFPAQVTVDGGGLRGRAQVRFAQSTFGYRPYSALLGALRNRDEVILHVDLVAVP